MAVEYRITLDDEHAFNYKIELERDRLTPVEEAELHGWTRLEHQKCSNCPLSKDQYAHCPAAADLQTVVEDFRGLPAFKKAWVHVRTAEREYSKMVNLEEVAFTVRCDYGNFSLPDFGETQAYGKESLTLCQ